MKPRTWTEEQLREAVASSHSIAQVLRALGLRPVGGNYSTVRRYVQILDLDTSHWTGQGWSKGQTFDYRGRKPIQELLVENSDVVSSHNFKRRLLRENIIEYVCDKCGIDSWLDEPISLHLEHKNGNHSDYRLENLCLLCPNCHSQTDTYCGRNIGGYL